MIGNEFGVITKLYYGALGKRLENLEIDRYFGLIYFLGTSEEDKTQQAIVKEFKMDKTVLVRVLDYLSEKGYIIRAINPNDKRSSYVKLTPLALERMPEIENAVNQVNKVAFAGFDSEQQKMITAHIAKIKTNLFDEPSIDFQLNYK